MLNNNGVKLMDKLYEEMFRAMSQFRKLKLADMFPEISGAEFFVLCTILDKGSGGKITVSELASKTRMLPSAVSRTLKGLEEKACTKRTVNQKDRRNIYVELTPKGEEILAQSRDIMESFGKTVMQQVEESEIKRLILYLDNIYQIAEKEVEARKRETGKEKEHE